VQEPFWPRIQDHIRDRMVRIRLCRLSVGPCLCTCYPFSPVS
jgi:hypothetical protein